MSWRYFYDKETSAEALLQRFEQEFGTTECYDITGVDWRDFEGVMKLFNITEGAEKLEECAQIVGRTAEMVVEFIGEQG